MRVAGVPQFPYRLICWSPRLFDYLAYGLFPWLLVLPVIIGYTVFSHRVFWGNSTELRY